MDACCNLSGVAPWVALSGAVAQVRLNVAACLSRGPDTPGVIAQTPSLHGYTCKRLPPPQRCAGGAGAAK